MPKKIAASLLIGGDVYLGEKGNPIDVDNKLKYLLKSSDHNIVNLESPITSQDNSFRIKKSGPHLKADGQNTMRLLKDLSTDTVTLANNHIMDYGAKALNETLTFCSDQNISIVGAGANILAASKPSRLNVKNIKLSILNYAENEWASASKNRAGANPYDLVSICSDIQKEKDSGHVVIVVIHGGHEYYNLPSPRMVRQYRFIIDQGADCVIGHHQHCIAASELYAGKPIHYGLGNLVFRKENNHSSWYEGVILQLDIGSVISVTSHYVSFDKLNSRLALIEGDRLIELEKEESKRSIIISSSDLLMKAWDQYVLAMSASISNYWSTGHFLGGLLYKVLYKLKLNKTITNKNSIITSTNLLRCEAHRDLSIAVLEKTIFSDE